MMPEITMVNNRDDERVGGARRGEARVGWAGRVEEIP